MLKIDYYKNEKDNLAADGDDKNDCNRDGCRLCAIQGSRVSRFLSETLYLNTDHGHYNEGRVKTRLYTCKFLLKITRRRIAKEVADKAK